MIAAALILACFVLTGVCLAAVAAKPRGVAEGAAYALLFGLCATPFAVLAVALAAGLRISLPLLAVVSAVVTLVSVAAWWRSRGRAGRWCWGRSDALLLGVAVLVGAAAAFYYSDEEALLSLASYALRGEAKCFYQLSFQLVESLNPGAPFELGPDLYDVISTPGNAVFTAPFIPLLGIGAFRVVYALVAVIAFLFVTLGVRRWGGGSLASVAAGLVAVASPFALSVEVLDRNTIAFALSAALLYTLGTRPGRPILHGWLFAVAAGTGLRFLPLLNVFLVVGAYLSARVRPRVWLTFAAVSLAAFALNLPHLYFHGFHSLGESAGTLSLLGSALTEGYRAPLQPLPIGLDYLQQTLAHLGLLGAGLVLAGGARALGDHRREAVALLLVSLGVWGVLAIQRDWLEADKARIWLSAWLPVPLFAGLGLDWLAGRGERWKPVLLTVAGALCALGLTFVMRSLEPPVDPGTPERRPVYQSDTTAFAGFYRGRFASVGLLPGYERVAEKLDVARKRRLERSTTRSLAASMARSDLRDVAWLRQVFEVGEPVPAEVDEEIAVAVEVDFEKLVSDPDEAVRAARICRSRDVDLSHRESLLDIYHKAVPVTWQPEPLTVTIFPLRPEVRTLGQLFVELNAFASFGSDAEGFERIGPVHHLRSPAQRSLGLTEGIRALPQADHEPRMVLSAPVGFEIVLRYWVVDGRKGTPFRVDSWLLEMDLEGSPRVTFRPREPESYLQ